MVHVHGSRWHNESQRTPSDASTQTKPCLLSLRGLSLCWRLDALPPTSSSDNQCRLNSINATERIQIALNIASNIFLFTLS